ncbi:hypothetical protein Mal4_26410 [Maioricimonas rarisocia]|uniref:Uncharacterized protein n=1 Tax=Maioricimonas rarisocia TaxID=2528026 RepID=A0A517Z791_9PLAN|nr:hypothetical protein [Maioricimonas rarisocia]QDU38314.1 hypothetical protein Mal4_26410 [Maioricimonas rarisocia]
MAFLQNLSDDQIAILGCCGALAVSFGLMMVSYHFGRIVRGEHATERVGNAPAAGVDHTVGEPQERRRAA